MQVNPNVKVRDQHEVPTVAGAAHWGLSRRGPKSDLSDAHRTFKGHRQGQATQACMIGVHVFINEVGTQGTSSSADWWARLVTSISRIVSYLMLDEEFGMLTLADDQDVHASGPNAMMDIVLSLFNCVIE